MAHPDLDRLMNHCLSVARKALAGHGELVPFAAAIRQGGVLVPVVPNVPDRGMSGPAIVGMLTDGLCRLALEQQVGALALCYDGRVSSEHGPRLKSSDAIAIGLEHVNGESVDVFVPYRKRRLLGYSFGQVAALPRTRGFFSSDLNS